MRGLLVILEGEEGNVKSIYNVFIPTLDVDKAREYVKGNGNVLSIIDYELNVNDLTDTEKLCIFDRMLELQK